MNVKTVFKSLAFAFVAILSSCDESDDVIISMIVTPQQNADKESTDNELLISALPSGWVDDPETGIKYGYVDLGLSVCWAVCDLGAKNAPSQELIELAQSNEDSDNQNSMDRIFLTLKEYNAMMSHGSDDNSTNTIEDFFTSADNSSYVFCAWGVNHPDYVFYNGGGNIPASGNWDAPDDYGGNSQYDYATQRLGDKWATPTKEQWNELIDNCKITKLVLGNRENVYMCLTGPNGKSIIFSENERVKSTWYGSSYIMNTHAYLTSSKSSKKEECLIASFDPRNKSIGLIPLNSYDGYIIRPVYKK